MGEAIPSIPQKNPLASYLAHKTEIDAAVSRVLASGRYVLGPEVGALEREFAAYVGVAHGVGVGSGTDAMILALRALDIGRGDIVFTVSHTAVATVAAIELCGALPVLVDVDPETYTMAPESLQDALKAVAARGMTWGRPRAVVPVHLYGQPADMAAIAAIAAHHGLSIVEDCAQAHGAERDGRKAGTWGAIAVFSFYPTKALGAIGDGGMVVSDDAGIAARVRALREYGWRDRYISSVPGYNSRLDELQAAILRVKLRHLDDDIERCRALATIYDRVLDPELIVRPRTASGAVHTYHQYVVRVGRRDATLQALARVGVGAAVHYPMAVHEQPAYRARLPQVVPLGRTEEVVREILSLPMYPELGESDVRRAGESVNASVRCVAAPA